MKKMMVSKAKKYLYNFIYKYCSWKEIFTIIRFGIVGIVATLVHIFSAWFFIDYFATKNNIIIANTFAFLIAFIFSFFGHYFWTFNNKNNNKNNIKKALIKFFIIAITGFLINTFSLSILLYFGIITNEKFAIVIALVIVPVFTYLLSKFWGFKKE